MADSKQAAPERAVTPVGVNHLVLNVRDIEESHKFWTEIVGMQQVGALQPGTPERPRPMMRFYSADHDGKLNHHDIALVENKDLPPRPKDWAMFGAPVAVNHIAITLPGREAWLQAARLPAKPRRQVRAPGQSRHDPQPLYQRSQRLRRRAALRAAARHVGRRYRRRAQLRREPADRGRGGAGRRDRQGAELRPKGKAAAE